jgi:hypothetical protein
MGVPRSTVVYTPAMPRRPLSLLMRIMAMSTPRMLPKNTVMPASASVPPRPLRKTG